jgi:hypothetical protein
LQILRDRAERAETVAKLEAEQAQLRAREEIAYRGVRARPRSSS